MAAALTASVDNKPRSGSSTPKLGAVYVSEKLGGGGVATKCQFCSNRGITSSRREIGGGWCGVFRTPPKSASWTCVGHGGVRDRQQKLSGRQREPSRGFWPIFRIRTPEFTQTLDLGQSLGRKWIQHPQRRRRRSGTTSPPEPSLSGVSWGSVGGLTDANPPQPAPNRPNWHPTASTDTQLTQPTAD